MVLSSHAELGDTGKSTGWYLSEAAHPWKGFTGADHHLTWISPEGGHAPMDGRDLDDETKAVYEAQQADLQKRIERQSARVPELGKGPDFGSAEKALQKMQKDWAGLPPADAAKVELERFAKDERIQDELAAQKALDKVVGKFDPSRVAQRRKLAEELDKFVNTKKWSGTQAAQKAAAMRDEMTGK